MYDALVRAKERRKLYTRVRMLLSEKLVEEDGDYARHPGAGVGTLVKVAVSCFS